jgi:hypothetical protein
MMSATRALIALVALVVVACGGVAVTPTAAPTNSDPLIQWYTNGPISTTCGDWKAMTQADKATLTASMLATIRSLDGPASKAPATPDQVNALRAALDGACTAGSDCSSADYFCDTDRITFAAYAEYAVNLDVMRK